MTISDTEEVAQLREQVRDLQRQVTQLKRDKKIMANKITYAMDVANSWLRTQYGSTISAHEAGRRIYRALGDGR